ncbi:4Fe-4S cluster-binding domain-containing protein [Rhodovulum sulfidophilum]|uniref:radical SAM protein n=1 Tax=Rhodovulum sulfidophilum TaxID=35806 RepID=UPI00192200CF|nr:radical SAM protein [Rhodovulum sulfidophilum]MBL3565353.1 4Fe-4S cluster-binding domain-containing protein [Rhodovulum sulfidophilum]
MEELSYSVQGSPGCASPYSLTFRQLVLTLGYRCNMVCKSCFIGDKLNDHETQLSHDQAIEIIESAAKLQSIRAIAFVGGEPFVFYKRMLSIAAYVSRHYGCDLNVTTNGSFAKSDAQARKLLTPLHKFGLRWLLLSLDSYHLEHMLLDQAKRCLNASIELGIDTSVQVICRKGAPDRNEFRDMMRGEVDVDAIDWIENPCAAVGNAATMLNSEEMEWHEEIPMGGCNAGEYLNIQPDGEIKPCCGAGLMAPALSIGNAKSGDLAQAVEKANASGLVNSLISNQGPRGFADILRREDRAELLERHAPFTEACHACHALLTDPEVVEVLEATFAKDQIALIASRVLTEHGQTILRESYY